MAGYIIQQEVGGITMAKKERNLRKRKNGIYYFRKTHNGRPFRLSLGTFYTPYVKEFYIVVISTGYNALRLLSPLHLL